MTRIKKWICMSVLMLIAITISFKVDKVNAISYTADDTTSISSQYHDIFNNYFSGKNSYKYFTYKCTYGTSERNCYMGIDSKGNYLKIVYDYTNYNNYHIVYEKGKDENFSVSGVNIYEKSVDNNYIILCFLCFCLTLFMINKLLSDL